MMRNEADMTPRYGWRSYEGKTWRCGVELVLM
jgi:hypothetical protein